MTFLIKTEPKNTINHKTIFKVQTRHKINIIDKKDLNIFTQKEINKQSIPHIGDQITHFNKIN